MASGSALSRVSIATLIDWGTMLVDMVFSTAVASSSSMKKGTPSLLLATTSMRSGAKVLAFGQLRTMASASVGPSGSRVTARTTRRARSPSIRSVPAPGSPSRSVMTTSTGCPARLSAK